MYVLDYNQFNAHYYRPSVLHNSMHKHVPIKAQSIQRLFFRPSVLHDSMHIQIPIRLQSIQCTLFWSQCFA